MRTLISAFILSSAMLLYGETITNPGVSYKYHLQGIAADETGIYWSFTDTLVKTDYNCKVLKKAVLPGNHGGDLCTAGGKIYLAVLLKDPGMIAANNNSRSMVFCYTPDLVLEKRYVLPFKEGIDGITFYKNRFYIAPDTGNAVKKQSVITVFDPQFNFLKRCEFTTDTLKKYGAQNLTVVNGLILAAFYDNGTTSPLLDPETLQPVSYIPLRPSVGLTRVPEKISGNSYTFLLGILSGKREDWKCAARKITISPDNKVRRTAKSVPRSK